MARIIEIKYHVIRFGKPWFKCRWESFDDETLESSGIVMMDRNVESLWKYANRIGPRSYIILTNYDRQILDRLCSYKNKMSR